MTFTLDISRKYCERVPLPSLPGFPALASPEASVEPSVLQKKIASLGQLMVCRSEELLNLVMRKKKVESLMALMTWGIEMGPTKPSE